VLAYVGIGQMPKSFFVSDPALAWVLTKQLRCLVAVGALLPLIFGTSRGGVLRGILASAPARFLGVISYAFYLWHWVVIQFLADHHFGRHGNVLFVLVALFASIALATASWYLLERPVNRTVRRWLRRSQAEREPPSVVDPPDEVPVGLL
jgi:peptidoglycan/LPS O-acetylase OafA/YrhL